MLYPPIPIRQKLLKSISDKFLEDLPHIFSSHIEILPNLPLLHPFLDHLLVVPTAVVEVDLVAVVLTVLADLPKSNSSDCVTPYVEFSAFIDLLAHLNHRILLGLA